MIQTAHRRTAPIALLVMNPRFRSDVYCHEVRQSLDSLVHWAGPDQTVDSLQGRLTLLRDVELLFTGWGAPVLDRTLLDAAPGLRAVFYGGGSIRHVVTPEFWDREITITSAYGMNAQPVAAYAVGAILLSLKCFWQHVRREQPAASTSPPVRPAGTFRSTVGLVSMSQTGRRVAQLLEPHELTVLVFDPYLTHLEAADLGVSKVSLEDLFARSDVVSLHAPLLPETANLITGELVRGMKRGATLINTARGGLIREAELQAALVDRLDLTAVLDVMVQEPPDTESPLFRLPNVVHTPHIAGSQGKECQRLGHCMVDELRRYLMGEPMQWTIDQEKLSILA